MIVSRFLRLAYLSPDVLQMLVTERRPCAVSIEALAKAATLPLAEQIDAVFANSERDGGPSETENRGIGSLRGKLEFAKPF